jgi:methionyl-tRNA synthetase
MREGLRDFSISRETARRGASRFPSATARPSRTAPGAGRIYVWFDALTNYITGAGFPDDMASLRALVAGRRARHRQEHHPLPLPLLAGDADERRPAAAAQVFAHGFMLDPRRADEQDRGNVLDARRRWPPRFGVDGARYVVLREVPLRSRRDVSWDSLRPPLQRRPGQRLRQPAQPHAEHDHRYLDGERPAPPAGRRVGAWAGWAETWHRYGKRLDGYLLHDALAALWEFVGAANRRRQRAAVGAQQAGCRGDERRGGAAGGGSGDLLEACRLVGLAAAPFMPGAAPRVPPSWASSTPTRRRQRRAALDELARVGRGAAGGRSAAGRSCSRASRPSTSRRRTWLTGRSPTSSSPPTTPARARRFYSELFGWELSRDGRLARLLPVQHRHGRDRRRDRRARPVDRRAAARLRRDVDSIDDVLARVPELGGQSSPARRKSPARAGTR